jgi:outer membrane lipoprotein-sorting protein
MLIALIIGFQPVFSESLDKDECFQNLKEKYGNMSSVSLKFDSPDTKNFSGSLVAARGNKYVIEMKRNVIYCNGKTIWNHNIKDNKVLISNYDEDNNNHLSLEKFFFDFLENYEPVSLTESTSSLGNKSYVLQLSLKKGKSLDIISFMIWLNPKNYVIKSIKLGNDRMIQTINIEDLVIDKKISDKVFEFKPTGKEEILDYR